MAKQYFTNACSARFINYSELFGKSLKTFENCQTKSSSKFHTGKYLEILRNCTRSFQKAIDEFEKIPGKRNWYRRGCEKYKCLCKINTISHFSVRSGVCQVVKRSIAYFQVSPVALNCSSFSQLQELKQQLRLRSTANSSSLLQVTKMTFWGSTPRLRFTDYKGATSLCTRH